jgi:hypothetical protein
MSDGQKAAKVLGYGCLLPLVLLFSLGMCGALVSEGDETPSDKPSSAPKIIESKTPSPEKRRPSVTPSKTRPSEKVSKQPAPETTYEAPVVWYDNCSDVRAAGKAPIYRGQPGYASHLDRDGDGIGCDS